MTSGVVPVSGITWTIKSGKIMTSPGAVNKKAAKEPGVYAGKDVTFGPLFVINSIADGKNKLFYIHKIYPPSSI